MVVSDRTKCLEVLKSVVSSEPPLVYKPSKLSPPQRRQPHIYVQKPYTVIQIKTSQEIH